MRYFFLSIFLIYSNSNASDHNYFLCSKLSDIAGTILEYRISGVDKITVYSMFSSNTNLASKVMLTDIISKAYNYNISKKDSTVDILNFKREYFSECLSSRI